jgi:DNA ligase (NAD+)
MDALAKATEVQLLEAEEVGDRIAQSVIDWFSRPEHQEMIERLKAAGLQMETLLAEKVQASSVLDGKTLVVSGVFAHFSRDGIKESIGSHGGKVSGSISKKTSYVLAGDKMGPEKKKKAEDLGVPVISEDDYRKLIGEIQ